MAINFDIFFKKLLHYFLWFYKAKLNQGQGLCGLLFHPEFLATWVIYSPFIVRVFPKGNMSEGAQKEPKNRAELINLSAATVLIKVTHQSAAINSIGF